jgi:hypothetical protein
VRHPKVKNEPGGPAARHVTRLEVRVAEVQPRAGDATAAVGPVGRPAASETDLLWAPKFDPIRSAAVRWIGAFSGLSFLTVSGTLWVVDHLGLHSSCKWSDETFLLHVNRGCAPGRYAAGVVETYQFGENANTSA